MQARFIASVGLAAVALTATSALAGNHSNPSHNLSASAATTRAAVSASHSGSGAAQVNAPSAGGLQTASFPTRKVQQNATAQSDSSSSSQWQERELFATHQPVFVGPLGGKVVTVDGKPNATDARKYDITISAQGTALDTLTVYSAGLMTNHIHQELVYVNQQVADLTLAVKYRYDRTQPVCIAGVAGTCLANVPLDPTNTTWAGQRSSEADMTISVRVNVNGTDESQALVIPIVGQAFAILP